ncbi:MAG: hypothetical protein IPL46_06045 [Saprospiraceae bacterium]|nr:hypothetical protein [Saprospiraceae bacterium]
MSTDKIILDSIFHLTEVEIKKYLENSKIKRESRENIILKFIARLNDEGVIKSEYIPVGILTLKIGDLAFYCLAKVEKFPFGLATGRQNCTEPNISSEIRIPTNFIYYTQFERERLTYRFLKYYHSIERQELMTKGYD